MLVFGACAVALLFGRQSFGYGIGSSGDRSTQGLLYSIPAVIEVAIPDVRLELREDLQHAVLSWPVHLRLVDAGGIRQTTHTTLAAPRVELTLFLEPQLALDENNACRGLLGARVFGGLPIGSGLIALVLEGGGLAGTDGHGGFAGGGLAMGTIFDKNFPYLALVARRVWTTGGARVDFSLDVVLPFFIR